MIQTFSPATSTAFIVEGPIYTFTSATLTKSSLNSDASRLGIDPERYIFLPYKLDNLKRLLGLTVGRHACASR